MRICFPLHKAKDKIFPKQICIDLPIPIPHTGPIGDPGPVETLQALTTIIGLAASLPKKLPMYTELHSMAKSALDAAVADLGDDVVLHQ